MSVKIDGSSQLVKKITFNDQDVKQFKYGGSMVWCKPYSLTINATNCVPYIREYETKEPSVESQNDEFTPPSTIYHGDYFYIGAHGVSGYGDVSEQRVINVSENKTFTFNAPQNGSAVIPIPSWGTVKPHGRVVQHSDSNTYILFPYIPGGRSLYRLRITVSSDCTISLKTGRCRPTSFGTNPLVPSQQAYEVCDANWKPNQSLKKGENMVEWPSFADIINSHSTRISIPALVISTSQYSKITNVELIFKERNIAQAGGWGYSFNRTNLSTYKDVQGASLTLSTAPSTLSNVKYIAGVRASNEVDGTSIYWFAGGGTGNDKWIKNIAASIGNGSTPMTSFNIPAGSQNGVFEDNETSFYVMYHMFYPTDANQINYWNIWGYTGNKTSLKGVIWVNSYWQ